MTAPHGFEDGAIPLHYHFNMLLDDDRMGAFQEAIARVTPPGGTVVDLGGGTGVLSFFAARQASKVWCVERDPALVETARRCLRQSGAADRVEIARSDAREFLPPTPVDVVVCEMLHSAMVVEQQIDVLSTFKRRYKERFGGPLPRFVPEATILAAQPIQQSFKFHGYTAPTPMFQYPAPDNDRTRQLADPMIYSAFVYEERIPDRMQLDGLFRINNAGIFNAVRLATKNVLAVLIEEERSIDWSNQHLILPLESPIDVQQGDTVRIRMEYKPGVSINALQAAVEAECVDRQSFELRRAG